MSEYLKRLFTLLSDKGRLLLQTNLFNFVAQFFPTLQVEYCLYFFCLKNSPTLQVEYCSGEIPFVGKYQRDSYLLRIQTPG